MASSGKGSRDKGVRLELQTARIVSVWWYPETDWKGIHGDKLPFRRCPRSGGWDKEKYPHDLFENVNKPTFPFGVECKDQEVLSFDKCFKGSQAWDVDIWWKQVAKDSKKSGLIPMLVFRKNNHPSYLRMRMRTWRRLKRVPAWTIGKFGYGHFEDFIARTPKAYILRKLNASE